MVRSLREKCDSLRAHTKEITATNLTQLEEMRRLEKSLKDIRDTRDNLEDKVSSLKY